MKIGVYPIAAKPYHVGHDAMIRLAADECAWVQVFVSLTDRKRGADEALVTAVDMHRIWNELIIPTLPKNVTVQFVDNPVTWTYKYVGEANKLPLGTDVSMFVYGDSNDVTRNFPEKMLEKHLGNLWSNNKLTLRGVDRATTADISGAQMRRYLFAGQKTDFVWGLPTSISGDKVWEILFKGVQ